MHYRTPFVGRAALSPPIAGSSTTVPTVLFVSLCKKNILYYEPPREKILRRFLHMPWTGA